MSSPYRVKDIRPGALGSFPDDLTAFANRLFFFADDGSSGKELWVSNGSSAGTRLVKDLIPGREDGTPIVGVIASSDNVFFQAYLPGKGLELCVSDGTAEGTRVLTQSSMMFVLEGFSTVVGNKLFFVMDAGPKGTDHELWVTDGTVAGTRLVKDIVPGAEGSAIEKLTRVGNSVYFLASPGSGRELWISDGSATGTRRVTPQGEFFLFGEELVALGSALVFSAAVSGDPAGRVLWITDGNGGTRKLADINPSGSSDPRSLTVVGNQLFFTADDGQRGTELWISDGTPTGTRLVKEITPGRAGTWISFTTAVGNRLFFVADDGQRGHELWVSDGTSAGTRLVRDLQPGVGTILKAPKDLIGVGDTLYFTFDDPSTGRELWRSDGTEAGTQLVADINPGRFDAKISGLAVAGNRLYFAAEDSLFERELWALDLSSGLNEPTTPSLAVLADAADKAEGNAGLTTFTFRVNRSGNTSSVSSAGWSLAGSGSNPAVALDFGTSTLPSGRVTFAAGETSKTITVNVAGDQTIEADERFTLTLTTPTNARLAVASASGTIRNDDRPVVNLALSPASVLEDGASKLLYTFSRTGPTSAGLTVTFTLGGTASLGSDYTGLGQAGSTHTLSFATGAARAFLTLDPAADTTLEPDETVSLTLLPGTSYAIGPQASATGTIRNDDPLPVLSLAATTASRPEGHGGPTPFTFLLSRRGDTTGTSTVRWATTGTGTSPANAADFSGGAFPSGTATFAAGQTVQTLTVNVNGDSGLEANETFRLSLAAPTGATLSATAATASGTITNDDSLLAITPLAASKVEGNPGSTTPFTFVVNRTGHSSGVSTALWAVTGTGANGANGLDFNGGVLPSGTVSFAAGQTSRTLTVNVAADTLFEPEETFLVSLASASAGTSINPNAASATGRIQAPDLAANSTTQAVLQANANLSSRIDRREDQDWIKLNAQPGHYFYLTAAASGLYPQVDVVTGEQVVVAKALAYNNNSARSSMGFMPLDGKPLFARARMQGGFSGDYQLTLVDLGTAAQIKDEVLRLTNNERSKAGVAELAANPLLERAAQGHTDDMLRTGTYLAHTGSDGSNLQKRLERVGYRYSTAGENAATNYYSPADLVKAWFDSSGHKANLLNPDYEDLGVGFSVDLKSGTTYWIQNLGAAF